MASFSVRWDAGDGRRVYFGSAFFRPVKCEFRSLSDAVTDYASFRLQPLGWALRAPGGFRRPPTPLDLPACKPHDSKLTLTRWSCRDGTSADRSRGFSISTEKIWNHPLWTGRHGEESSSSETMNNRGPLIVFLTFVFLKFPGGMRHKPRVLKGIHLVKLGRLTACCIRLSNNMTLYSRARRVWRIKPTATLPYCRIRHRMARPAPIHLSAGNPASAALSLHARPWPIQVFCKN
ncbi:hypothetical protein BDV11DRAFT_35272 [Aspergillus similis]